MSEIELILKSPTDRVAPFPVKCINTWTIKQVKIHIYELYPCKPIIDSQKLIYSGKLLKDDQILSEIFEKETSAIVHFICQQSINSEQDNKKNKIESDAKCASDSELRKEYQNYLNSYYSSSMNTFTSMDQNQQMMWLNHAYMQSYATFYNQTNIRSDNIGTMEQACPDVVQRTVTNEAPSQENPPNNNERRIEPAGDNGMQNMVAAAFGGLMGDGGEDENDGDVEPRDILHYFYMFVRFGLLLLICYYYSSMFSVVTTLMLFFLFFGVNFFRRNNHVNQQPHVPIPQNGEVPVPSPPANEDAATNITPEPQVVPPPAQEVPWGVTDRLRQVASTSIQFVLTFFITLFPDPVAHINVN